ncbi:MAG: hypothetical protein ACJA2P_002354 [Rhodoferax sp.]|jgi:hypothetical protein
MKASTKARLLGVKLGSPLHQGEQESKKIPAIDVHAYNFKVP